MNGSLVRQQIRSLIVLIFLAITLSGIAEDVPGPVAVIELEATGVGETLDAALRESFRDAVHRAVGTFISSEQVVKNEELIRDQVTAHSDAFVQGYDKISEKQEQGLFRVTIRARVARAKLAQQLSKSGLTSKTEIGGENMFAEATSKLDKAKAATELLAKLFEGFPKSVCKATLIGKPAIVAQDELKATLRLRVRVGVDANAYAVWHQNATRILRQISQKITPFRIDCRAIDPTNKEQLFFRARGIEKSLYENEAPTASQDKKEMRFNRTLDKLHAIQKHYNKIDVTGPISGMKLCISKFGNGLEGEAYELDEDARLSLLNSLSSTSKSNASHRSIKREWKNLDVIRVEFKSGANALIKACQIDSADYTEVEKSRIEWLAPYGPMVSGHSGVDIEEGTFFARSEQARIVFIRPGFILKSWVEVAGSQDTSGVISCGVAFDYEVTVSLDELRKFHHVELSLGK